MNEENDSSEKRTGILVVDDHPVFRHGLTKLIEREPTLTVCGEVESAAEALRAIPRLRPALVLVDLSLNGTPGLDLIKSVHAQYPDVRMLVVSMHDEVLWAERALRSGAAGYIMKQEKPRTLIAAIKQIIRGETWLSPSITNNLISKITRSRGKNPKSVDAEDSLGDRELQVLQLIGEGLSTRKVAEALDVSVKTVDAHREHIKRKLDLQNGSDLLRYAILRFLGDRPR